MPNEKNLGWLLLTNDDGIQAIGMRLLVEALNKRGHKIVVFAPSNNQSATGMRINLMKPLNWRHRNDLKSDWSVNDENLHLIELDGTPCDTMIVALDKGLQHILPEVVPRLVVSGVNLGPNMSQDSYHSGTMGAAREAGLYGMPAIASSLTSFDDEGMEEAVNATVEVIEQALEILPMEPLNLRRPSVDLSMSHISRWPIIEEKPAWSSNPKDALRTAFRHGELMLNINTPPNWNGQFQTTRLGMRWYRDAISFSQGDDNQSTATFTIGAASIDHTPVENSDCDTVMSGESSISCLPTWPQTHPLAIDDRLLTWCLESGENNYPVWLNV
ncbi:MAG: 5'/3'-nucleotidase SurE [Candidatus Thermoplasmatota archaeon]|nr:5'/3'-nucleotidase SurE [Candidatus Thermoplasmatota archaeon]